MCYHIRKYPPRREPGGFWSCVSTKMECIGLLKKPAHGWGRARLGQIATEQGAGRNVTIHENLTIATGAATQEKARYDPYSDWTIAAGQDWPPRWRTGPDRNNASVWLDHPHSSVMMLQAPSRQKTLDQKAKYTKFCFTRHAVSGNVAFGELQWV